MHFLSIQHNSSNYADKVFTLLLEYTTNIDQQDSLGNTALTRAIENGRGPGCADV
jgi:ankyrin repeat protein